ncbi:MAG: DUF615 domain-containing protein [Gammaproteobacteria bacterium]|nr:MAG: DUF615 domain-containing protein [Gammaproteobacteria bacterium]
MTDAERPEQKSKSQIKREYLALQHLGANLIELSLSSLESIPISDVLREAIKEAKKLKRGALKRQVQYIGGLMRDEDTEAIQQALNDLAMPHRKQVQAFHQVEKWRDALIAGDDELMTDLANRFENADRQHIRQLVRNAVKEKKLDKTPKSARLLFQYLSELQAEES